MSGKRLIFTLFQNQGGGWQCKEFGSDVFPLGWKYQARAGDDAAGNFKGKTEFVIILILIILISVFEIIGKTIILAKIRRNIYVTSESMQ